VRHVTDPRREKRKNAFNMNHLRHGIGMTDHMMFEAWADLLRPQFPAGAEFTFKPRRRLICVSWPHEADSDRPSMALHSVAISFTQLAWKSYRGSRTARMSRADANLSAFVMSALAQYDSENAGYETAGSELQITVASVDLFPPPEGTMAGTGQGAVAG
jgi:hypothetical protein